VHEFFEFFRLVLAKFLNGDFLLLFLDGCVFLGL
jgi:hypothetical protein